MRGAAWLALLLVLALLFSGCSGRGDAQTKTDDAGRESTGPATKPSTDPYENFTFTSLGTVDVAWPLTPAHPSPREPGLALKENVTVVRFEVAFSSQTGGTLVSGSMANDEPKFAIGVEGGRLLGQFSAGSGIYWTTMNPYLRIVKTMDANITAPATLEFDVAGWGDTSARVIVLSGKPMPPTSP